MLAILSRYRGLAFLKLLFGIGLLIWVIAWNDNGRKFMALLAGLDTGYIGLLFLIAMLARFARVVRWQIILRDGGVDVRFLRLLNLNLIGNFISNFLPSMFGGDAAKSYFLGRQIGSQGRSAASVVFDRFAGLSAMVSLALVFSISNPALSREPLVGTLVGLIALGLAASLFVFININSLSVVRRRLTAFSGGRAVSRFLNALNDEFQVYRGRYGLFARAFLHSVIFYMFTTFNLFFCCLAIGIAPSFFDIAVITPIAFLLMSVPISPNNIGWWEWSMSLLLVQTGADSADGLTVALILRAVGTSISMLGGVLLTMEWLDTSRAAQD